MQSHSWVPAFLIVLGIPDIKHSYFGDRASVILVRARLLQIPTLSHQEFAIYDSTLDSTNTVGYLPDMADRLRKQSAIGQERHGSDVNRRNAKPNIAATGAGATADQVVTVRVSPTIGQRRGALQQNGRSSFFQFSSFGNNKRPPFFSLRS